MLVWIERLGCLVRGIIYWLYQSEVGGVRGNVVTMIY